REKASAELVKRGTPALPFLRKALTEKDLEVVRRATRCIEQIEGGPGAGLPAAAVRLLAKKRPDGAAAQLLRYVPFADDESVEEEVRTALVSLGLREGKADAALVEALKDAEPARRAAAAFVVGRSSDAAQRKAALALLEDADRRVR